jgi:hypothetical protein
LIQSPTVISTAALFSPSVYAELNPDWKQQLERPEKPQPQELMVTLQAAQPPPVLLSCTYAPRSSVAGSPDPRRAPGESKVRDLNPQREQSLLKVWLVASGKGILQS